MLQLSNKSLRAIQQFTHENSRVVYWYMVLRIYESIKKKDDKTYLFSFGSQNENIALVNPKDYERVLLDAMEVFSKNEEYEHAAFARDVLQKWKIEQVLNQKPTE